MLRYLSAEGLRINRFWLPRVLLGALVVIVALEVSGKIDRLKELEIQLAAAPTRLESAPPAEAMILQTSKYELDWLRGRLRYPGFIGYAARLTSDFGWFFVILFTAVIGGEDYTRRTLRSFLARGVSRGRYLVAHCLALWVAAGIGVLAVVLLAAAAGPLVHAQVTDDPILLVGLDDAMLEAVRAWLTCLPFVIATLFWVVLARRAGPAMGVGIGLHFYEFLNGLILPIMAVALAGADGATASGIWRWQLRVLSVTLGYNADVLLHWGAPFMRAFFAVKPEARPILIGAMESGAETLLPTTPWRAAAFLAGYGILFLGSAMWVLRRRDVTYGT
jgi:ABC-type transport system involved in multi-copper enzyme maturation permease subunit